MKTIYTLMSCGLLAAGLTLSSCEGMLDQVNPNKATEVTFWNTEKDFELALTSCYTPLKNALNGGYYGTRGVMLRICRADEVEFRNDISEIFQAMNFTNTTSNSLSQGMFYQFYNALYRTNSILQKLEEKKNLLDDDFIKKVKGECLFIRGFYLFQLGKEFKDAPLRLTASQDHATFPLEKSSQSDIWKQAKEDLYNASKLLPIKNDVIGKPTQEAALATWGKILVYEEDFTEAIKVLEPLTKAPFTYKLVSDFSWNFDEAHEHNEESIFELLMEQVGGTDIWGNGENSNSTQTNTRPREYASPEVSGWYEANPTQQMMDIFLKEKDKDGKPDIRARESVAWNYPGCMYYMKPFNEIFPADKLNTYWILKYQNSKTQEKEQDPPKSSINERAIRYADVILLLAEAHLRGNSEIDIAIDYLNQIRRRANLNDYSGEKNVDAVFAELEHQRAIEFFVEGERFYDLRRWGLLEKRMQTCNQIRYKQLMTGQVENTNRYYYYPIPAKEIETNPLCSPNAGW